MAAGLAAASGGSAFTGRPTLAGILAILAAAVSALLTSVRPDERAQAHLTDAGGFSRLVEALDLFRKFGILPTSRPESDAGPPAQPVEDIAEPGSPPGSGDAPAQSDEGGHGGDRLAALQEFKRRYETLEAKSQSVMGRHSKKAGKHIAKHDEWHPPPNREFAEWWEKRLARDLSPNN